MVPYIIGRIVRGDPLIYSNYQHSRDAVWRLLIDLEVSRLPIRLNEICKALGIELRSIEDMAPEIHLENQRGANRTDGVARFIGETPVILYNTMNSAARSRFTIAHEIGHFILGHVEKAPYREVRTPVLFRSSGPPETPEESAANVFASRLLAPACVLWGLGVQDARQIERFCWISREAAEFRMARMHQLYQREQEYLETRGYSCFLIAASERLVYEQFREYVEQNRL